MYNSKKVKTQNQMEDNTKNISKKKRGSASANRSKKSNKTSSKSDRTRDFSVRDGESNADRIGSLNDISWYNRYPELLNASAQVPFPYRPGMPMDFTSLELDGNYQYVIPGVCAIKYYPIIGYSDSATSPASSAARELYAKVRNAFSGSLPEDAPDILMYLVALDSIYSYIASMKRIYRTVNTFTPNNYAFPTAALVAMGVNKNAIDDLRAAQTQGWYYINELIRMSSKFICPAVMDIFNRHYWMNDNIYLDAPKQSSQAYVFVPSGFYSMDDINAQLVMTPVPTLNSWSTMYQYGLELINALSGWGDAYTISGHLMRAFEGAPQFTVDLLDVNDTVTAVFEPEVLIQIENATTVPLTSKDYESFNVTQNVNTNAVICTPTSGTSDTDILFMYPNLKATVNLYTDNPDPASVTIATRLQCMMDANKNIICGTEVVHEYEYIYYNTLNDQVTNYTVGTCLLTGINEVDTNDKDRLTNTLTASSAFSNHPKFILFANTSVENETAYIKYIGNIDNLTFFDREVLEQIHRVCIMSEFNAFSIFTK